jgi:hypothetical protein
MNFIKDVIISIMTSITQFGKYLRSLDKADVVGFILGFIVVLFMIFAASKIWRMAVNDQGFYESTEGPNLLLTGGSWETTICMQQGDEPGFTKCWKARRR